MTMVSTPPTRCSTSWLVTSVLVIPSTATVPSTKTVVNPATNSAADPATRQRAAGGALMAPDPALSSSCSSASSTPTTAARYDRYPGTSGTTHGEANDTSPASMHTPSATSSGPAAATSVNPVIVVPVALGPAPFPGPPSAARAADLRPAMHAE